MRFGQMAFGSLVGTALIFGSIAPAAARDRRWDGYGHRHHNDFDFGDAVGIAALIGAVAIAAGSMSKARDRADGVDNPVFSDTDTADAPSDYTSTGGDELADENAAVDACAVAARDEATSDGGYAEIRDIAAPRTVSGGWDVDGRVERRAAYRDGGGDVRRFTCSVRDGRVSDVYLSKDIVA